jgi:hypothetical protein
MFRHGLALLILGVAGFLCVRGNDLPAQNKPSPDEIRKRFYRCWLEIERVDAGKRITDVTQLTGCEFTDDGYWCWGRVGELAAGPGQRGVVIDPTAEPMRVTFLGGTRGTTPRDPVVLPGIFKFEGDKLILALGSWTKEQKWEKGKDYPDRPREFNSTKKNGYILQVFRRCQKYDQD